MLDGVVPGTTTQVSGLLPNKNAGPDTLPSPFLCQLLLRTHIPEFCCVLTCSGLPRNLRDAFSHCPHFSKQETEAQKSPHSRLGLPEPLHGEWAPAPRWVTVLPLRRLTVTSGESGDSARRHGYCNEVYLLGFLFLHTYLLETHFVPCVPQVLSSLYISFFIVVKYTRHFFNKDPYNQSYGFLSTHVWM